MEGIELEKRKSLLEPERKIFSQRKQCELLGIARSGLYYRPRELSIEELELMRAIDEQYLKTPFYGRRRMTVAMRQQGFLTGEKRIRTAMKQMGLEAIYPKPNLSKSNNEHTKYPYLMKNITVDHADQAWAADITYLPLHRGFGYLFAIIDWYSRYVIEWELSNLLDVDFCIEALERSLKRTHPEIFNTDQGVQFTSHLFTKRLEKEGVRISMDGKGRALDNVFVERLWRSVKYEDVYPKGYNNLKEVGVGLRSYFQFYNEERPHQGLGYRTPAEVYYEKKVS
ncbi:MAG: IS3 family transposase [Halobacteriovoraceae bacterium]|nr:IS3 family transposase [Halobacteriovoraceae bacterium]